MSEEHHPVATRSWNPLKLYLKLRRMKIVTVEPVLFLYMFGLYTLLAVDEQYVFNRYGRQKFEEVLNYTGPFNYCMSTDILDKYVGNGTGDVVESETANLNLITSIAGQFPSIFAALAYGPLSDRIGRKPIILIVVIGSSLTATLNLVIMYFNLTLWLLIPVMLLSSLTGGLPGMLTGVYSYLVDVSSHKWLTLQLGVLESMIFISGAISLAVTGTWLRNSQCYFQYTIWLCLACNLGIIIYVLLLLPESLTRLERKEKMKNQITGIRVLVRGVKIFIVKEYYSRWRLWFAIITVFFLYLTAIGVANISTLFLLHKPLEWGPQLIGIFQSVAELAQGITLLFLLPSLVAICIPESMIILIGIIINFALFLATGFVRSAWEMFVVGVIQGLGAITGPPLRSSMSKAVAVQDQGALFSIIAATQVLASVVASVVFFYAYPASLKAGWEAGSVYFLLCIITLIPLPFTLKPPPPPPRPVAVDEMEVSCEEESDDGWTSYGSDQEQTKLLSEVSQTESINETDQFPVVTPVGTKGSTNV